PDSMTGAMKGAGRGRFGRERGLSLFPEVVGDLGRRVLQGRLDVRILRLGDDRYRDVDGVRLVVDERRVAGDLGAAPAVPAPAAGLLHVEDDDLQGAVRVSLVLGELVLLE